LTLSPLDIGILVILLIGAIGGFRKGLILEVISIVAFIFALIGAIKLLDLGVIVISDWFNISSGWLPVISFIAIFILIIGIIHFLGNMLRKAVQMIFLGLIDQLAGALLGILKYAFAISALIWIIDSVNLQFDFLQVNNFFLFSYLQPIAPAVFNWFSEVFPTIQSIFDTFHDTLLEKIKIFNPSEGENILI